MKRKRKTSASSEFDLSKFARFESDLDDVSAGSKPLAGDGHDCFALDSKLATSLTEGYARQRRQAALETVAAVSRETGVTFPATLEGPGGTLIDMTTLVLHTGARFLSRADLCAQSGGQGVKPLCPPDADEATRQRYAADATAALLQIMNGAPPRHLPLDAIAGLLEQAQYFGAVFVASLLPHYFRPLASQLKASQAKVVLLHLLPAVQGPEAAHAYKGILQVLAPCLASPGVPVRDFSAASLEIVAAASECGASGSKLDSNEMRSLLLDLAGGLAEFETLNVVAPHKRAPLPGSANASNDDVPRAIGSEALLCIVVLAAACCVCDGSCASGAVAPVLSDAASAVNGGPDVAAMHGQVDTGDADEQPQQSTPETCDDGVEVAELEGPAQTLQRCIARCRTVIDCDERLSAHATAAVKVLLSAPAACRCRDAAVEAALSRTSLLQRVAAGKCDQHAVVAQDGNRIVLATMLRWPSSGAADIYTSAHPFSQPCAWAVTLFTSEGDDQEHREQWLGLYNDLKMDIEVKRWHFLLPNPDADLSEYGAAMHTLRQWARTGLPMQDMDQISGVVPTDLTCVYSELEDSEVDVISAKKSLGYSVGAMATVLAASMLGSRVKFAAGEHVLACIAFVQGDMNTAQ